MVISEARKLVWVNDDWAPSWRRCGRVPSTEQEYELVTRRGAVNVTVKYLGYGPHKFVRVAAWGADDTGYEKDFEGTEPEMKAKFNEWTEKYITRIPQLVNKRWFKDRGFKRA